MFWRFALTLLLLTACTDKSPGLNTESPAMILGGRAVKSSHPLARSVVGILNTANDDICTGTIISPSHILTAAHCLGGDMDKYRVVFGTEIVRQPKVFRLISAWRLCDTFVFEQPKGPDICDIAILKLAEPMPEGYQPIDLEADRTLSKMSLPVLVMGYGVSNGDTLEGPGQLRLGRTTILDPNYGETEFRMDQSSGKGACHGDSGGPVFILDEGKVKVLGVISRGQFDRRSKCLISHEVTYAASYMLWISETLANL